jgi:mediator of RNA polymerase II transcription subunit 25
MFTILQNGNQNQQNMDAQRHCILVAASNPYPLPTPVYRPPMQNLEKSENIEEQTESRSSDAETVAKSFAQVLLALLSPYLLMVVCIFCGLPIMK